MKPSLKVAWPGASAPTQSVNKILTYLLTYLHVRRYAGIRNRGLKLPHHFPFSPVSSLSLRLQFLSLLSPLSILASLLNPIILVRMSVVSSPSGYGRSSVAKNFFVMYCFVPVGLVYTDQITKLISYISNWFKRINICPVTCITC